MHINLKNGFFLPGIILLFVWAGCTNPDTPPAPTPPPSGSINEILANLPKIEFALPKSLQGDDQTSRSRAMGDITVLSGENVQRVKSDAWFAIRQNNGVGSMLNLIFNKIKTLAAESPVNSTEPFTLPLTYSELNEIMGMAYYPSDTQITARGLVNGTTENFDLYLYMRLAIFAGSNSLINTGYSVINIDQTGANPALSMHSDEDSIMSNGTASVTTTSNTYVNMNLTDCTGVLAAKSDHYELGNVQFIQKVLAMPGSSLALVSKYKDSNDHTRIAWGNDTMGGIVYVYQNISNNIDSYEGEFYNSAGNLICRERGDNSTLSFVNDARINVYPYYATAPASLYLKQEYVTDHWEYYYTDNIAAPDWQSIPAYGWNDADSDNIVDYGESISGFMWKQGAGSLIEGDVLYQWKNVYSDTGTMVVQEYEQSYTFASVPVFDHNYFLMKEYPLGQLLPLAPAYAASYELIKQELETVSDQWTNLEGTISNWSYTNYQYYLNKIGSADTFDAGVDVMLNNLSQHDIYYWNSINYDKQKAYFYNTSGTLPAYFTAPDNALVTQVKAQMESVYNNEYQALSFDDYAAQLGTLNPDDSYFTLLKQ